MTKHVKRRVLDEEMREEFFLLICVSVTTNTTNQSATVVERYASLHFLRPSTIFANVPKKRRMRIR